MKYLTLLLLLIIGWLSYTNVSIRKDIQKLKLQTSNDHFTDLGGGVYQSESSVGDKNDVMDNVRGSPIAERFKPKIDGAREVTSSTTQVTVGPTERKSVNSDTPHSASDGSINRLSLIDEQLDGGIKIGEVTFDASLSRPWSYKLYARTITVDTLITTNEDGTKSGAHEIRLDIEGKTIKLPIGNSKIKFSEEVPKLRFRPRVFLGLSFQLTQKSPISADVGIGLMDYGNYHNPDWQFILLGAGMDTDGKGILSLNPIVYRISKVLPITQNLYVGPNILTDGSSIGLGLSLKSSL